MGILDRVKKLCADKGISVGDLEKELELSNGSIYKWSRTIPGADKVEKVADYFNVSVDYLLGRTAFKTPMELFEHFGGHNNPYFESPFDFAELLKKEREMQDISKEKVSKALNITTSDVEGIEEGLLPLNYDWAEKYAEFLGTSVSQIFFDNDMYDEQIPPQSSDNVTDYENFKKAIKEDALSDSMQTSKEATEVAEAYGIANLDKQNIVRLTLGLPLKKNSKPYLLPNAAHEIEGSSEEDKAHDDALMDDEDF